MSEFPIKYDLHFMCILHMHGHLYISGHWLLLVLINNVAMNMGVHKSPWLWGIHQRRLLGMGLSQQKVLISWSVTTLGVWIPV